MIRASVVTPSDDAIDAAVGILRRGGVVAIPTETVYGLAADASNEGAVRRVFSVKGRPADHPVIVHIADAAGLNEWARDVPPAAVALAAEFWPGPLTLVVQRAPHVSDVVTGGQPTVGLRVPDQPVALRLLQRFGGGLAAPSANRFGRVSPTRAEHVAEELGGDVDLILDGGPCRVGVESTIVQVTSESLSILRAGAITSEQIERVAGRPVHKEPRAPVRAPGMLPAHYAPAARVVLAGSGDVREKAESALAQGHRVAVLAEVSPAGLPPGVHLLEPVGDATGYARHLYERLRETDALGCDVVIAVPPEPVGVGIAVCDRLTRAAHSET